ncbi:MAG: winged helix-turn-helix transcriptional regulator [Thermoplasmata archaeon]|nr:MAG: winged helix-turn-helix transcriptional regulator [Thermoplasmata archaeon]
MKLNKNQIKILRLLSEKGYGSVSSLAKVLKLSPSRTDVLLKDLQDLGLVEMKRSGKAVEVHTSINKHAKAFRRLVTLNPHLRYETILTNQRINILISLLRSPMTKGDISLELDVSERTIERALSSLMENGIIISEGRALKINPQHYDLMEFIREFISYVNVKIAGSETIIIWEYLDEFIVETKGPLKRPGFLLTGFQALEDFGVPLIVGDSRQYLYSPHKIILRVEDVCLHIMMINPRSIRAITYIVMATLKNKEIWNWGYMESESKTYNVEKMIRRLKKFIKTKGKEKPEDFPSWKEIKEKAKEYGIHG